MLVVVFFVWFLKMKKKRFQDEPKQIIQTNNQKAPRTRKYQDKTKEKKNNNKEIRSGEREKHTLSH